MARKKRRRSSRKKRQEYPGWLWMLFGLALGLSVAFAVYVKDRTPTQTAATPRKSADMESATIRVRGAGDSGRRASDTCMIHPVW